MAKREFLSEVRAVLVVDRDDVTRRMLSERFASSEVEVSVALSADEALVLLAGRALEDRPFDVVVSEVSLLGSNGYELVGRIRTHEDPRVSRVPVVFLSSRKRPEDVVAGFRAGGDDYVAKPWDFSELEARIGALVRRMSDDEGGAR